MSWKTTKLTYKDLIVGRRYKYTIPGATYILTFVRVREYGYEDKKVEVYGEFLNITSTLPFNTSVVIDKTYVFEEI